MRISIAAPALSAVLLAANPLALGAAPGCSNDAFTVTGAGLSVELCALPRESGKAPTISETLAVRGQPPLARKISLDAALGDEISRTIDDAPLQALGIAGTLHMTISYKNGSVRLEHALLVPGAIALK